MQQILSLAFQLRFLAISTVGPIDHHHSLNRGTLAKLCSLS